MCISLVSGWINKKSCHARKYVNRKCKKIKNYLSKSTKNFYCQEKKEESLEALINSN